MHQLSTAQSSSIVSAPAQFDQTTLANAGASTMLVGGATRPPPDGKETHASRGSVLRRLFSSKDRQLRRMRQLGARRTYRCEYEEVL
eukprot:901695-Pyramimonas_sp.AAC.1